jgi:hypothetical protein
MYRDRVANYSLTGRRVPVKAAPCRFNFGHIGGLSSVALLHCHDNVCAVRDRCKA